VEPVVEYGHGEGCSVTGGFVYRGHAIPELIGHYVYADYCSGWIRSFRMNGDTVTDARSWEVPHVESITSFGEDARGELYVLSENGPIYRIERASR